MADWAAKLGQAPPAQQPFVKSLGASYRTELLKNRKERKIPDSVEFVAVLSLAVSGAKGDSVVHRRSQWPADLQEQRIPCVRVQSNHGEVMLHDDCLKVLCELATQPQRRWSEEQVRHMRKELGFGGK